MFGFHLIDDIHNYWKFWSVRWGVLAAGCTNATVAYAAADKLDPALVAGIPHWVTAVFVVGAMVFSYASVISRGLKQDKLGTAK